MKEKLITAAEALKVSKESSVINEIMAEIKKAASTGGKSIEFQILNEKDIALLQDLGYVVKEEFHKIYNYYYSVSWSASDD